MCAFGDGTKTGKRSANRGFSLIELLIVIAIILIIAAIAIPNFMRARMNANETAAVSNLRTISTAQVTYITTYANGFAPNLVTLSGAPPISCAAAGLIDDVLASGQKTGYNYALVPGIPVTNPAPGCAPGVISYMSTAIPAIVGSTGQRSFCAQENGLIRQDVAGAAIAAGACTLLPAIQ
jgi:prepilin-type N-terminal cleavage/methylation domain-containing protein